MKSIILAGITGLMLLSSITHAQPDQSNTQPDLKIENMEQIFIDKFVVPQQSKQEFTERMTLNRNFIKTLEGFVQDAVYERTDEQGNWICITIAVWKSEEALKKAKEAVQAEYKKQGFNPAAFFARLNISMDRGTYRELVPH